MCGTGKGVEGKLVGEKQRHEWRWRGEKRGTAERENEWRGRDSQWVRDCDV